MTDFITVKMQIPTFTNGAYHMNAILADAKGNIELVDLNPDSTILIDQYFAPCSNCGIAILQSAWYEDGDCCAFCGITMPEAKPTTVEEAKNFILSCINFFKDAFHPDTKGEDYINIDTNKSTFNNEEAVQFNINMQAAFNIIGEDSVYEVINKKLFS